MQKISIVGVPMDLGADRRGVDMGPSALRYADLNEKLQGLVGRGLVSKVGRTYRGLAGLDQASSAAVAARAEAIAALR